jgi:splicing factor U2AF subunit
MELGDRKLIVQRASVGSKGMPMDVAMPLSAPYTVTATGVQDQEATKVVQLMNMVTPEELEDPTEYQGKEYVYNRYVDFDRVHVFLPHL